MADSCSNYLRDKLNDHLHGGTSYTSPSTTYWSAMTTMPTSSGGGVESSLGRLSVANNSTNWPASSGQIKSTGVQLNFGNAASGMTIVGVAEYDASTGGNLLQFGLLATSITLTTGQPFSMAIGALQLGWLS